VSQSLVKLQNYLSIAVDIIQKLEDVEHITADEVLIYLDLLKHLINKMIDVISEEKL